MKEIDLYVPKQRINKDEVEQRIKNIHTDVLLSQRSKQTKENTDNHLNSCNKAIDQLFLNCQDPKDVC